MKVEEEKVPNDIQIYCLVPLLTRASIHANTAGVFKGFYKGSNGIGKFGGEGGNALERIMGQIKLDIPKWNNDNDYHCECYNNDINSLVKKLETELDIIYLDPPYNQHPYGSNYFMLNIIAENKLPDKISSVSGVPTDWKRSCYNKKPDAKSSMKELIKDCLTKTKYILLSYNNEGFIKEEDWNDILNDYKVEKKEILFYFYKVSRNLKKIKVKVLEKMFLISLTNNNQ